MIIKDVHISGFGKLNNADFSFDSGINLICGHNESGKSTLHSFIFHMLFGINRARGKASRLDAYKKYCPWDYPDSFGGSMRIEADGITYLIERSFNASDKSFSITNEATGETSCDEEYLTELLGGISENDFNSTLNIRQSGINAGDDMSELIKRQILNTGSTASTNIDVQYAVRTLNDKKKELASELDNDARKKYYEVQDNIEALRDDLEQRQSEIASSPAYEEAHGEALKQVNTSLNDNSDALKDEYDALTKELADCGFKNVAELAAVDSTHKNLCRMYQTAKSSDEASSQKTTDKEDASVMAGSMYGKERVSIEDYDIKMVDIIKGSIISLFFIISIVCFVCGIKVLGIISLLLALAIAAYTALPFLPGMADYFKKASSDDEAVPAFSKEQAAQELSRLYIEYLGSGDINRENRDRLNAYLSDCKAKFSRLSELGSKIQSGRERLLSNKEAILNAKENNIENAKLFWETDNIQEQLDALEDEKQRLESVLEKNRQINDEIASLDLAINTIKDISSDLYHQNTPSLNSSVSSIFGKITGKSEGELLISDNLNITLNDGKRTIPLHCLSQGTIEQIYMSLRLATADLLLKDSEFPLIIDEAFAMYDNPRLANTFRYIFKEHKGQTFIFSCQNREKLVLEKINIPFNFIKL
ncbi:MAG: AAA family ATPase [Lachnospiraceae bacterium]|nr:AAA family ATPase [Lachnospiraceae bacterium]